jgi:hypothetical protein
MNKRILWFLLLLYSSSGENMNTNEQKMPCNYPENKAICVCPGDCMIQLNNNSYCKLKKCYKWELDNNKCKGSGENYYAALILHAIPPTGIIGIGDLIMKRLDLFAISLGISLGGCIFILCSGCCCGYYTAKKNDHGEGESVEKISRCYVKNGSITWLLFMFLWWCYRLYFIGTNQWLDGNGCVLSKN